MEWLDLPPIKRFFFLDCMGCKETRTDKKDKVFKNGPSNQTPLYFVKAVLHKFYMVHS